MLRYLLGWTKARQWCERNYDKGWHVVGCNLRGGAEQTGRKGNNRGVATKSHSALWKSRD